MKKIITIAILILVMNAFGQTPNWEWAKSGGGTLSENSNCISVDGNGNTYITGYFQSSSITFGTITLTNSDNTGSFYDIFIVKYSPLGNVLWAKSHGSGLNNDVATSISIDTSGNVFITGNFHSPTITFGTTNLTNSGGDDIFIAKYDDSGNVLWAKSAGQFSADASCSISTDANGNAFLTGYFYNSTLTFGTISLTNAGWEDIFIVKYSPSGNVLWAKRIGGASSEGGGSVSTDSNGNLFVSGYFQGSSITFGTTTLMNNGARNIFIVKYSPSGNVLWAKSAGGISYDYESSLSTDSSGNVFMTGGFTSSTITFGSTTLTNANNSGNKADIFIVKYNALGNVLWAKSAGGNNDDYGQSICTDANGNVFMIGFFYSPSITFDTTTLTNADSTGSGSDILIVKFDSIGNLVWTESVGGMFNEYGNCISTDINGNIFLSGWFYSSSIIFGTNTLTNTSSYYPDIFIAKSSGLTGIEEIKDSESITIAPNPFSSLTTIIFSQEQKNSTIKIIDMLGKAIKVQNFTGKELTIEKGEMQEGIYFVQTTDERKNVTNKKIIIQ